MLGRTYAIGYEPDLPEAIPPPAAPHGAQHGLAVGGVVPAAPKRTVRAAPSEEQRVILAEHGAIGMSFGAADYAHDVRLACYGLDKSDNDFVIRPAGQRRAVPAVQQACRGR
jgi:chlorite dismutase